MLISADVCAFGFCGSNMYGIGGDLFKPVRVISVFTKGISTLVFYFFKCAVVKVSCLKRASSPASPAGEDRAERAACCGPGGLPPVREPDKAWGGALSLRPLRVRFVSRDGSLPPRGRAFPSFQTFPPGGNLFAPHSASRRPRDAVKGARAPRSP